MGRYRIRIEALNGNEELEQDYTDGIECDGFAVLAHQGDGCQVALHQASIDTISDMIVSSNKMCAAGILAKAKYEIRDVMRKDKMDGLLDRLLGRD